MTCLDAQSKIIAYIENKLERPEKLDFLRHIKYCHDCREELDIYYTMIEGMRQMDENEPLSKDFSADLENKINRELATFRKNTDLLRTAIILVFFGVMSFAIIGYVNFLRLLEEDEQQKLKDAQGEYYFSETFDDVMFYPKDEERIFTINVETDTEEVETFYDRINRYRKNGK